MSRLLPFTLAAVTAAGAACSGAGRTRVGEVTDAAEKVYVAPGKYDEFYAFMSGCFDGQVGVWIVAPFALGMRWFEAKDF